MNKLKIFLDNPFYLILLAVFIGGFFRLYNLAQIPVGFHIDEAQVGYNAYSLWKTGFDETGKYLPTHLTLWKVDRPLFISYLTIPGVMLFGLNELGTRLPTAIIGTLTIILVFFLTVELFGNKYLAIITSFLFAVSPWHIILSRATSEAVGSLFFYIGGALLGFLAIRKNSYLCVLLSYIAFSVSFFFYHSTRITIPFLLVFFTFLSLKKNRKLALLFGGLTLFYLIFPLFSFSGTSTERFKLVSIFSAGDTNLVLQEQIREDGNSVGVIPSRLFHNKAVNYSTAFLENMASHFTYTFLVSRGGLPIRYSVPNMGLTYLFELVFGFWGVFVILRQGIRKNIIFVFGWVFLGVFSSSLTVEESPNINRTLFVLPAIQWLGSLGLWSVFNNFKKRYITIILMIGVLIIAAVGNLFYFWHQYTVHTIAHKPWYRFFEMKEVVTFLTEVKQEYRSVYLTFNSTEPYIYFLFYNRTDPLLYQKQLREKGLESGWNRVDNIRIIRNDCPVLSAEEKINALAVYKITCKFPKGSRIIKKFTYPDKAVPLIAVDFPPAFSKIYEELNYEIEPEILAE